MVDGLSISALVHDAIMVLAPLDDRERHKDLLVSGMKEASRQVLGGFEIDVDVKVIMPGEHYYDENGRGDTMWGIARKLLNEKTKSRPRRKMHCRKAQRT
jgi:DNA polymerase I